MQRVSCESRGDVKDRHNEIRIRPRKPDGVRVSSLVPRPVETVWTPRASEQAESAEYRRGSNPILRTMSNAARFWRRQWRIWCAVADGDAPVSLVRCLAPL